MNKTLLGLSIVVIGTAQAGNLTVPNDFTPDTPALADEVNENFAATEAAVNDNDARISTLEGGASYAVSSLLNDFSTNLNSTFVRVVLQSSCRFAQLWCPSTHRTPTQRTLLCNEKP